jgi:hypothetical protein
MAPLEEWRFPGMNDMEIVGGKIKEMSLIVVHRETRTHLKEIFKVQAVQGNVKRVLQEFTISTPELKPYFFLHREVHETDVANVRASWNIPGELWDTVESALGKKKKKIEDFDLVLKIYRRYKNDESEWNSEIIKKVSNIGNWYFGNVPLDLHVLCKAGSTGCQR